MPSVFSKVETIGVYIGPTSQTLAQDRTIIVGFNLTVVNEFCRFLSQFATNFQEILNTLFSFHVVTTLKVAKF